MEQSWEMISDHFGGGTGDTMDPAHRAPMVPHNPLAQNPLASSQVAMR